MPRKLRLDLPDSMYHVTALGAGDEQLYREPADRRHFLAQLGPQGITGYAEGRPQVREVFGYWPMTIARDKVQPKVEILET